MAHEHELAHLAVDPDLPLALLAIRLDRTGPTLSIQVKWRLLSTKQSSHIGPMNFVSRDEVEVGIFEDLSPWSGLDLG